MTNIINATTSGMLATADSSTELALQTGGVTALTLNVSQETALNSTGAITVPSGTTAQRPTTPVNGMVRYNTDNSQFEGYVNDVWIAI